MCTQNLLLGMGQILRQNTGPADRGTAKRDWRLGNHKMYRVSLGWESLHQEIWTRRSGTVMILRVISKDLSIADGLPEERALNHGGATALGLFA